MWLSYLLPLGALTGDDAAMAWETRLLYVGIARARRQLLVTGVGGELGFGKVGVDSSQRHVS